MYFLYLDESGDCNSWTENRNFVIGGIAVHEGQVQRISKQLNTIQQKYFPTIQVQIPFHATDIRTGHGRFRNLTKSAREELLIDLYEVIKNTDFPKIVVFSTVLDISTAVGPNEDLSNVFSDIASRFNAFLMRGYSRGPKNKGMVIIDHAHEEKYMEFFKGYRDNGTKYGSIYNIVDIPYFAKGRDTRMIQVADLCAYAVFRRYENSDFEYFNFLKNKFDREGKYGKIHGLKHMTREECDCVSCKFRKK